MIMIIGVDAGCLGVSDDRLKVGVYRVVLHTLQELGKQDKNNVYRLYSFYPIDTEVMRTLGPRMKNIVLSPSMAWFTLRLPLELLIHPVDLFLGVSQAIPWGVRKSIGWIYDVGFIRVPRAYPDTRSRLALQTEMLVKRASHILTISESVKKDIRELYNRDERYIDVSYPGVDAEFTQTGKKFIGKHPYVLFVGSLKKSKNIPVALQAFALFLKSQRQIFDFLLIGSDYWLDTEIIETVKTMGLSSRVKFLGFVNDRDLPLYYRGATAFLSPSLWEGFCLPVVESMACGCPVIGSTTGSLPEIIGKGGILVDPNDISAIASALSELSKPDVRSEFVPHALKQASTFRWDKGASIVYRTIEAIHKED